MPSLPTFPLSFTRNNPAKTSSARVVSAKSRQAKYSRHSPNSSLRIGSIDSPPHSHHQAFKKALTAKVPLKSHFCSATLLTYPPPSTCRVSAGPHCSRRSLIPYVSSTATIPVVFFRHPEQIFTFDCERRRAVNNPAKLQGKHLRARAEGTFTALTDYLALAALLRNVNKMTSCWLSVLTVPRQSRYLDIHTRVTSIRTQHGRPAKSYESYALPHFGFAPSTEDSLCR